MKMEQSVPKRGHINSRRRVITQKKAYNLQNTAKAWLFSYLHVAYDPLIYERNYPASSIRKYKL